MDGTSPSCFAGCTGVTLCPPPCIPAWEASRWRRVLAPPQTQRPRASGERLHLPSPGLALAPTRVYSFQGSDRGRVYLFLIPPSALLHVRILNGVNSDYQIPNSISQDTHPPQSGRSGPSHFLQ